MGEGRRTEVAERQPPLAYPTSRLPVGRKILRSWADHNPRYGSSAGPRRPDRFTLRLPAVDAPAGASCMPGSRSDFLTRDTDWLAHRPWPVSAWWAYSCPPHDAPRWTRPAPCYPPVPRGPLNRLSRPLLPGPVPAPKQIGAVPLGVGRQACPQSVVAPAAATAVAAGTTSAIPATLTQMRRDSLMRGAFAPAE